jgi:hypothetical protein
LYFGVIGNSPRSMNTRWPRSLRRNSMKARAAFGIARAGEDRHRLGRDEGVLRRDEFQIEAPRASPRTAMYDGTAKPALNSPLATTVGTSRLPRGEEPGVGRRACAASPSPCLSRASTG